MRRRITQAAIIGSGTMGSGIAGLLASVGIETFLLDIVPESLTDEESARGLSLKDPVVRDRIARSNKERFILKAKPEAIMDADNADLIKVGNIEDNLDWLSSCDWILEAVPEKLEIKRQLLKTVLPHIPGNAIVSTNTSGISIDKIAEGMPPEFRKSWLGTHFFNPARYMKLLEIIPGKETSRDVVEFMEEFGERVLGKGVVVCKDTPNFIANRVGAALGTNILKLMMKYGLTVSEVDEITGTCIGRPKTATFALYDLVGLDIGVASATVVRDNVLDEEEKANLAFPDFVYSMLKKNLLGNKTKGGFYRRDNDKKRMIDPASGEYVPVKPAQFPSLEVAKKKRALPEKLSAFFEGDDVAAKFVWEHMKRYFVDTAAKIPEISDEIHNVDRALRWGYNHDKGPFEIWQGLNLKKYVDRMAKEGETIPAWVLEMLSAGNDSFYREESGTTLCYSVKEKRYLPVKETRGAIVLRRLAAERKIVKDSETATLYDIGDGILCLEMHTKTSAISEALLGDMQAAQEELWRNWDGMVITGRGSNFCVGADLVSILTCIENKEWTKIEGLIKRSQDIYMRNKYSYKPVVVAPHGMVLGGGCEITMHSSAVQAAGETYMGLVELGVGLIPAGGGVKETTIRALERTKGTSAFAIDFLAPGLQNMATARVSGSAREAAKMGYLDDSDGVTLNLDLLICDAKRKVLEMVDRSYSPKVRRPFPAPGMNDNALMLLQGKVMRDANYISDYDLHLIRQLAHVMTGGGVSKGVLIDEEYLLKLERDVFVDLCKEPKTQDRIRHMLATGKPLRN